MPNWKKVIISGSDAALNSLEITSHLTASGLIYPTVDGTDGQILLTNGDGVLSFEDNVTYVTVKNVSSGTLTKGTPVHSTGTSGNTPEVIPASASLASAMPANFVLAQNISAGTEGRAVLSGFLNGVDTNGFDAGDVIYVAPGGSYTVTKPEGDGNLIQNVAIVGKVGVNGSLFVYGSGRSNDVPNLPEGKIWVGDGNTTTSTIVTLHEGISQAEITGSLVVTGNITASANISASGDLYSGASLYIDNKAVVGPIGAGLAINGNSSFTSGTFINRSSVPLPITLNGNVTSSANITAAGNISASSLIYAGQALYIDNKSTLYGSTDIVINKDSSFTGGTIVNGTNLPITLNGNVTASANISASGTVFAEKSLSGAGALPNATFALAGGSTSAISTAMAVSSSVGQVIPGQAAGQDISAGQLLYQRSNARWYLADASSASGTSVNLLGIALNTGGAGAAIDILIDGVVTIPSSYITAGDIGNPLYVDTTAGSITKTAPSSENNVVRIVGHYIRGSIDYSLITFKPDGIWVEL